MSASELQALGDQVNELVARCEDFVRRVEELRWERTSAESDLERTLNTLHMTWNEWLDRCVERWGHWEYDSRLDHCPSMLEYAGHVIGQAHADSQTAIKAANEWLALHIGD